MTEPKTVAVRIALAVGRDGEWNAVGCNDVDDDDAMAIAIDGIDGCVATHWVSAVAPVHEAQEISGTVEAAADA
ncbi:MAG: hypothetical protein JNM70_24805 [Anaerolineae bacterium]|nr:hypothetical protein [Anaerolineae bacterium]